MKIKTVVTHEEVIESEISLPFYYLGADSVGEVYVKIVTEDRAVTVRPETVIAGKITSVAATSPDMALRQYKHQRDRSKEQFEDAYMSAALFLKGLAAPDYILTEEDRQDFQHSY
jgi:hypothetical protein